MTTFDTNELREELRKAMNDFSAWSGREDQNIEWISQEYLQTIQKYQIKLHEFKASQEALDEKRQTLDLQVQNATRKEQCSQEEAAKLRQELQGMVPQLKTTEREIGEAQNMLDMKRIAVQEATDQERTYTETQQRGIDLFRSRLGLAFERIQDHLRLVFTLVDPRDPTRRFVAAIRVDPEGHYHLRQCEPAVHGMAEPLQQLNATNDLGRFVVTLRGKFAAVVAEETKQQQQPTAGPIIAPTPPVPATGGN
ncbi:putative kinetochore protein Spc25; animal type [Paratrimastix pyriformis]|uniref:Kinetochore protein SPC25 n=1 Tax=Paratrimastix pyriformis TaxID=342808 RepID=A0ABQ8U8F3_9EUKA|nr:putative kinetochore protein Spc25; animal type [Paratrimastix pyriformis]